MMQIIQYGIPFVATAIMLLSASNKLVYGLIHSNKSVSIGSNVFKHHSQLPSNKLRVLHGMKKVTPFFASSVTTDASDRSDEKTTITKNYNFVTPKQKVYIEDTDAYGVMYNANYLRTYDRALHMMMTSQESKEKNQNNNCNGILNHDGWCVTGMSNQRFKSGISLGSSFVISGELEDQSDDGFLETWNVQLTSVPDPTEPELTIYNSAKLKIARPEKSSISLVKPFEVEKDSLTIENFHTVYRDEFDIHMPSHIPLRNVLNLFERERSDFLGGPDVLRKMQDEDDLLWVVTEVSDLALVNFGKQSNDPESTNMNDVDSKEGVYCEPGQKVVVRTNFIGKRRGMIIECRQTLFVLVVDESTNQTKKRRLAQGKVTIMAIKNSTRRPTKDIPEWFLQKLK